MKVSRFSTLHFLSLGCALAVAASLVRAADATPPPAAPAAAAPGAGAARGPGGAGFGRGGGRGPAVIPGPPAPVPPQVAIPRPNATEIAQANDALKKLVTSDAATKALLEKYPGLISVQTPRVNTAIAPTTRNADRHAAFVETAKKGDIDLLLHGDSITDWWVMNGKEAYDKYFGGIKTANFAIAGDTTQGVLWGLQNGEGQGFSPKAIMLMIGTNNGGNTAAEVAEGIGAVVLELRKDFPNAKILLLGVFPHGIPTDPNRAKISEINKIIAKLDDRQRIFFMDIGSKFLDPATGAFLPDTFRPDNLHPVLKGYEIWGEAVKDKLAELMK